jgi:Zn-dependent protease with chaperone function
MPILLVFVLTAACAPVGWPESPLGLDAAQSATFTAAMVAFALSSAFAVRTWVVRTLHCDPGRRPEIGQGYVRLRRLLFFMNLGLVAVAVLVLGWGATVREISGAREISGVLPMVHEVLAHTISSISGVPEISGVLPRRGWGSWDGAPPGAELLVPLPYFLILFGCWLIYYDAERALYRTMIPAPAGRFWSRGGYFVNNLRQLALLVCLPVGLFVTQQSLARTAPGMVKEDWYRAASIAIVPVLILFMPLVIKPLLGLRTLPAGPLRDRLQAIADRLHFRCTDFLLWPTHGAAANAMIVGLLPRVRYVIFTDRILEEMPPDELEAVFGHEVGHAKHGHIWYYAVFLMLSMAVIAALLLLIDQILKPRVSVEVAERLENFCWWLTLVPLAVAAGYFFLVFGFLSRRCERQADVYGCRAVSCGNPACTGHDALTVYPPRAAGLCPTGIRTFARALERVEYINGPAPQETGERSVGGLIRGVLGWLRAWQHSTIRRRVAFLHSLIDDPARERRFQCGVKLLRWGLVLGLAAALAVLGTAAGWQKLLDAM